MKFLVLIASTTEQNRTNNKTTHTKQESLGLNFLFCSVRINMVPSSHRGTVSTKSSGVEHRLLFGYPVLLSAGSMWQECGADVSDRGRLWLGLSKTLVIQAQADLQGS